MKNFILLVVISILWNLITIKELKNSISFFLYDKKANKGNILKLNHAGHMVSQASFNYKNNRYLYIDYQYNDFNVTENIYFINHNLKIVNL